MSELKPPKGISEEMFQSARDLILSGFEKNVDPNLIKSELIRTVEVPFNRLNNIYTIITKHEGLVTNPAKIKKDIAAANENIGWSFEENWEEIGQNIEIIREEVPGASKQQCLAYIKQYWKENETTFPKKPLKSRGRIGTVNKTIIDLFAENSLASEKDIFEALKNKVNSYKNAESYAKKLHKFSYALANKLTSEEVLKELSQDI